jgi:hypothetical protein
MRHKTLIAAAFALLTSTHASAQLACTRFYPSGNPSQVGIYNNCDKCMRAAVSWCDGSIRNFEVAAHSGRLINTCIGVQNLVGESPCSAALAKVGASAKANGADASGPALQASEKSGVATMVTRARVTTRTTDLAGGGSCSAHNDVGDVCSISCPVGQAALCTNAAGGGTPTCECRAR